MPTAMTPVAQRVALVQPVGADPVSLSVLMALQQGVADRSEWNAKSLIVAGSKTLDMALNDYPDSTTYTTVSFGGVSSDFSLTVSTNDLVLLFATGAIAFTLAVDSSYEFRWYDGAAGIADTGFKKAAAWTVGETLPVNLTGLYVAASSGAKTFSFQGRRTGSDAGAQGASTLDDGYLKVSYVHVKLGAA